jgi:endonuclease YncB( thermonuclease family)
LFYFGGWWFVDGSSFGRDVAGWFFVRWRFGAGKMKLLLALFLSLTPAQVFVVDGDTLKTDTGERIRLLAVDAPETYRPHCRAEKYLGALASAQVERWLASATVIEIERDGVDRYGRTLARVKLDGMDISEALIDAGLATKWPKPKGGWC